MREHRTKLNFMLSLLSHKTEYELLLTEFPQFPLAEVYLVEPYRGGLLLLQKPC